MGSINEEFENYQENGEKIFVSVRIRPFNEKERARNSRSDWECINNDTIVFKNSLPERSMFPAAYTFGKHFHLHFLFLLVINWLTHQKAFALYIYI